MRARVAMLHGLATLLCAVLALPALAQHQPLARGTEITLPSEGVMLPMLEFGGRPVVEVHINGKGPYQLILDTGAAVTVLDDSLADELSLQRDAPLEHVRIGTVMIKRLDSFTIPISRVLNGRDVPRGVLSGSAFPGLLLSFDYPARQIVLKQGELPEAEGRTIFSYLGEDLPSLPVTVAGRVITVHLDTGAPYALALPTRFMGELPLAAQPMRRGSARTHAGVVPIYSAQLEGELAIGEFALATRELRFTDVVPDVFAVPKGQVGNEAFREFIVTLDSAHRRVRLERRRGAGQESPKISGT